MIRLVFPLLFSLGLFINTINGQHIDSDTLGIKEPCGLFNSVVDKQTFISFSTQTEFTDLADLFFGSAWSVRYYRSQCRYFFGWSSAILFTRHSLDFEPSLDFYWSPSKKTLPSFWSKSKFITRIYPKARFFSESSEFAIYLAPSYEFPGSFIVGSPNLNVEYGYCLKGKSEVFGYHIRLSAKWRLKK